MADRAVDFFVSYAGPDRPWAEWAASVLERAGYSVALDVWDWSAGDNAVLRMQDALARAHRVVALFSPAYFDRHRFTTDEWTAVLVERPDEGRRRLIPVRVAAVEPPLIFRPLISADVFGLDENAARQALLTAVEGPRRPTTVPFPDGRGAAGGPRLPGSLPPVWNVPRRHPSFTGRTAELAELRRRLVAGHRPRPVQALSGMGGVGKTQLAIEYAYLFGSEYDVVWWLDAERPELIGEQLAALGVATGWVDAARDTVTAVAAVGQRLRTTDRWLLIFDDAERLTDLINWLPSGGGDVIVTSRKPLTSGVAESISVEVFDRAASVALLQAQLPTLAEGDADRLAERVGDLPLALAQAADLLAETGMTVDQYLAELGRRVDDVLAEGLPAGYPFALAGVLMTSTLRLEAADPAAARVLRLCAMLGSEPIPLEWFDRLPAGIMGAELAAVTRSPLAFRRSLGRLAAFGLAQVDATTMRLHRLTQAVLRDSARDADRHRGRAVALLRAATPDVDATDPASWPAWATLLPHLLALDSFADDELFETVHQALRYLVARGEYRTALTIAESWSGHWTAALVPDDPRVIVARLMLAETHRGLGNRHEARRITEDAWTRSRRVLGGDDARTLDAAAALADDLRSLGDLEQARALDEDVLTRRRQLLGNDHPDTIAAAGHLAADLRGLGAYGEARILDEDTLERRRRVLGDDHPETLRSASALAETLRAQGEYGPAQALHEDTLARRRRVLGDDHPETSASDLAATPDDEDHLGDHEHIRGVPGNTVIPPRVRGLQQAGLQYPGRSRDLSPPPAGVRRAGTLGDGVPEECHLAWSPDGGRLASATRDGALDVWAVADGQRVAQTRLPGRQIRAMTFGGPGARVAVACTDGAIAVWQPAEARLTYAPEPVSRGALAWHPARPVLAAVTRDGVALLDEEGRPIAVLPSSHDTLSLAFDPSGDLLVTGHRDGSVGLWDTGSRHPVRTVAGHTGEVLAVAFDPEGERFVTAGADRAIRMWRRSGDGPVLLFEGQTEAADVLSFSADGRMLAAGGRDGAIRFSDASTGAQLSHVLAQRRPGPAGGTLAFHPAQPLLAAVGAEPAPGSAGRIRLWQVDPGELLGRPQPAVVSYTSAKIVLVGDQGVGKTGLAYRLVHGEFREQSSTHGQQFWVLDSLAHTRADGTRCEAVLWDLAGQRDYRLIHALSLDDTDVALLLFDPTRDDPMQSVDYWLAHLRAANPAATVILVAARVDVGHPRATAEEIEDFCRRRGIARYLPTSAKRGDGLAELVSEIRTAVSWDERPTIVTTEIFRWIKEVVLGLKEASPRVGVILDLPQLRESILRGHPERRFTDDQLLAAAGHLAHHGYVAALLTSRGETRVLLVPELVNNLAASIVNEARGNPKGLGSIEEQEVLSDGVRLAELGGLTIPEREILLDTAIATLLRHNVCFRQSEPLKSRVYLVFPDLINLTRPIDTDPGAYEDGPSYFVTGATEHLYASLVVLLGYTDVFARVNQWRDRAQYEFGGRQVCGFRQQSRPGAVLEFVLYFGAGVSEGVRTLFQGLFESFLERRDLRVRRVTPVVCAQGHRLTADVVWEHLRHDRKEVFCWCGERLRLPAGGEGPHLTGKVAAEVDEQRHTVTQRAAFEEALYRLQAHVAAAGRAKPTCFISYAWGDARQERWVEQELAADLVKAGISVRLDRWENSRIGSSVSRFVEEIGAVDRIVVVGTPAYRRKYENRAESGGFVVAAEGDLINVRMLGDEVGKASVLPIVLEGDPEDSLPPLLHGRVYGDFRQPEAYLRTVFDLILSIHAFPARDAFAAQLRASVTR